MIRTIIDIHAIQTVPPSNINRDDTGSPKTAVYGGVRRARVSSQAWKRATRKDFETYLDRSDLGVRTKRVVELVSEEIARRANDLDAQQRDEISSAVLKAAELKLSKPRKGETEEAGYLVFLGRRQVESLAALGVDAFRGAGLSTLTKKAVQSLVKDRNAIDVSLFGRMVADVTDLNVDAAAQVAHAISVHAVETEFDFFTAVDDQKNADAEEDAGAGMIGTVEFNSSTLYRYATVDVDGLLRNLGDVEATVRAVEAFVRSFVTSMPTGKQNTFANRTLPDAVVVMVREDQPVSLVGAFEEPITSSESSGRVESAVRALVAYADEVGKAYGTAPATAWTVGVGDRAASLDLLSPRTSFDQLVPAVGGLVRDRLGSEA
ncbi:type I-E CRISPR-associated protein Cas7/Cse4/CasC [Cellulomonas sp. P24]|uniref:type I-E CRISPR-associated protein Cas7/Cse4/CasC n=1 Tax=Cellulomonas sp. P24 TaxID=2885206 RepID=UPI00216AE143|nr:type I-E CRISPR-associated protein Cas7/Cse4/CasC [Cellulomonas sp. P24]MCR6493915.1 type I-E CRISPR-associated protein Cas7/Cse4/CasC [Cellulomonas sp. P24]